MTSDSRSLIFVILIFNKIFHKRHLMIRKNPYKSRRRELLLNDRFGVYLVYEIIVSNRSRNDVILTPSDPKMILSTLHLPSSRFIIA